MKESNIADNGADQAKRTDAFGRFAGQVADTFILSGRLGVVVVPIADWAVPIWVEDKVRLVKPDGTSLLVRVGGIELVNPSPPPGVGRPLLLMAEGLLKSDVPVHTELWLD